MKIFQVDFCCDWCGLYGACVCMLWPAPELQNEWTPLGVCLYLSVFSHVICPLCVPYLLTTQLQLYYCFCQDHCILEHHSSPVYLTSGKVTIQSYACSTRTAAAPKLGQWSRRLLPVLPRRKGMFLPFPPSKWARSGAESRSSMWSWKALHKASKSIGAELHHSRLLPLLWNSSSPFFPTPMLEHLLPTSSHTPLCHPPDHATANLRRTSASPKPIAISLHIHQKY